MLPNEKENLLYSEFDYLLEILKEYEVTLSMGNGMRPGAVRNTTYRAQPLQCLRVGLHLLGHPANT
jgi:phosphomethylpyrimidine synthase